MLEVNAFHLFEIVLHKQPSIAHCEGVIEEGIFAGDFLTMACLQKRPEIVKALIARGADVNNTDAFHCSRFLLLSISRRYPQLSPLLSIIMSVAASVIDGLNPVADSFGSANEIIHILLQHGADPELESPVMEGDNVVVRITPRDLCKKMISHDKQDDTQKQLETLANLVLNFNGSSHDNNEMEDTENRHSLRI